MEQASSSCFYSRIIPRWRWLVVSINKAYPAVYEFVGRTAAYYVSFYNSISSPNKVGGRQNFAGDTYIIQDSFSALHTKAAGAVACEQIGCLGYIKLGRREDDEGSPF